MRDNVETNKEVETGDGCTKSEEEIVVATTTKQSPIERTRKGCNMKNPRPTKASLIRMNLNKPTKHQEKSKQPRRLAINFEKAKGKQKEKLLKEQVLKQVDQFIKQQSDDMETDVVTAEHGGESLPRVPVGLHQDENLSPLSGPTHKTLSVVLEPTYCPENYSDFEECFEVTANDSFHIPSSKQELGQSPIISSPPSTVKENDLKTVGDKENKKRETSILLDNINGGDRERVGVIHNKLNEKDIPNDEDIKEKSDLYQLLYEQQNQLAALQKQVSNLMKQCYFIIRNFRGKKISRLPKTANNKKILF